MASYNPTPEQLQIDVQTYKEAGISWALQNLKLFDKPFIVALKDGEIIYSLDADHNLVKESI